MRTIEAQKLVWTNWVRWENRTTIPDIQYPGVYLIAISNKRIENTYPHWQDVNYIGMSNSKRGLKSRWSQLHSAICGNRGHSGGNTIYGLLGKYSSWDSTLFVACMSVKCNTRDPNGDDYIKMGLVTFFEYEAFAQYYIEVGGHPLFNKK